MTRMLQVGMLVVLVFTAAAAEVVCLEGEACERLGGPGQLRILEREEALGGKVLSYWDEHGSWAEWEFELPADGVYALSFRYAAAADTERRMDIDGRRPPGFAEPLRFPRTGDYRQFDLHAALDEKRAPLRLELTAGKHVLRLTNENSTGLALDAILVHSPSERFVDQALPDTEAEACRVLISALPVSAPAASAERLAKGHVEARFDSGLLRSLVVGETLFFGTTGGDGATDVACFQTENIVLRCERRDHVLRLLITDGKAAYLVLAGRALRTPALECSPRAYRSGERLAWPAVWRTDDGRVLVPGLGMAPTSSGAWSLGSVRLSTTPELKPNPNGRQPLMRFAEAGRVAAAKIAPAAWRHTGLAIDLTRDGNVDTLHSCARSLPGIAAFYDYAEFEIRFVWQEDRLAECELVDLASRERLSLIGAGD